MLDSFYQKDKDFLVIIFFALVAFVGAVAIILSAIS
tara:strand:+ start:604 stop:711 length:108 start_codon:yes stop_codon:yes gene_type:complete